MKNIKSTKIAVHKILTCRCVFERWTCLLRNNQVRLLVKFRIRNRSRTCIYNLSRPDEWIYLKTSLESSNCCKRVLETAKLAEVNKTSDSFTSWKLGSCDLELVEFWILLVELLCLIFLLQAMVLRYSFRQRIKQNCLLKCYQRIRES